MPAEVSIIIPLFNQLAYTQACLIALRQDPDLLRTTEIIAVDNGSTDGTRDFLEREKSNWPYFKTIYFDSNHGFSPACNAGAGEASAAELVFLNNDTEPQSGWLCALRKTLKIPGTGLAGPKLLYPGKLTINHAGYVCGEPGRVFYGIYHDSPADFQGVNRRRDFQALLGACYLIKKELFESLGGFANYGLEDIDLCLKVREAGFRVVYEPRSVVLHHGSVTLKQSPGGSIPQANLQGFNSRWSKDKLIVDEHLFYSEDGIQIEKIDQGTIEFKETYTISDQLVAEARQLQQEGDLPAAEKKLESAIDLYLGNFDAYNELLTVLLERGSLSSALKLAEKMCKHVAQQHQAQLLLGRLYEEARQFDRAILCYTRVAEDWCVPEGERQKARDILEKLIPKAVSTV